MKLLEKIESLTNASSHLDYAQRLISRGDVQPALRDKFQEELGKVWERLKDENLYIAVVGRASTGKSTFINALLGDMLLESGVLHMTTSAATFIQYGKELSVEVRFRKTNAFKTSSLGKKGKANGTLEAEAALIDLDLGKTRVWRLTAADEPINEPSLPGGGVEGLTVRELIAHLTTSSDLEGHIASITITHPSEFLKPGLVIIDTPGADAQNQLHKELARRTVERADAAIIITPAEQAISKWLLEIIQDKRFLKPIIHRCVILITRMDIAHERMRRTGRDEAISMIHQNAIQRLKTGLGAFDMPLEPKVYVSAAQAVVDEFSDEEAGIPNPEERQYWQNEFSRFQQELMQYLIYQRAVTISESVLRLLGDLFESIETHLSELWDDYNIRRGQLKEVVKDIDSFCKEQKKHSKNCISKAKNDATYKLQTFIDKERDKAIDKLSSKVYGADSLDELKTAVNNKVNNHLTQSRNSIVSHIQRQLESMNREAINFDNSFEKQFNEFYAKLKLLGKVNRFGSRGSFKLENDTPYISLSDDSNFEDINMEDVMSGAVIGGVIGSIIPGLGPILGALIGGAIGSFLGPSLDERKNEAWYKVEPAVTKFYNSIKEEATQGIVEQSKSLERKVQQHIGQYADKYRVEVKRMRNSQLCEREELEEMQSTLENDLKELKNRRGFVVEQRAELRQAIETNI